jgi:hypothetical protein
VVIVVMYAGWFSVPLLLLRQHRATSGWSWQRLVAAVSGAGFVVCAAVPFVHREHWLMPRIGLNISPGGLGEWTVAGGESAPPLPESFWVVVTVLSVFGGYRLVVAGVSQLAELAGRRSWTVNDAIMLFLWLGIVSYPLGALLSAGKLYDRYLVPALPFLIAVSATAVASANVRTARKVMATLSFVLLAAFAVCGTRDYFSWNRARWRALDELAGTGVAAADIDGGFEFNQWKRHDPRFGVRADQSTSGTEPAFMIALSPAGHWRVVRQSSFSHWLPPYTGQLYTLARADR